MIVTVGKKQNSVLSLHYFIRLYFFNRAPGLKKKKNITNYTVCYSGTCAFMGEVNPFFISIQQDSDDMNS